MRRLALILTAALFLAGALVAQADVEKLPAGSIRVRPATVGSPSKIAVSASFAQPSGAELQAYNVDIARGFRFDTRAVSVKCTIAQARAAACPAGSQIGSGSGNLTVQGATLPKTEFTLGIRFYLTPPQQRGDIAGLVLAGHEPKSGLNFALLGRLLSLVHGPYGLELRFAHTASELPSGFTVQLHHVHVLIGTERRHGRTSYHLLRNPNSCTSKGWRFLLTVAYSSGTEQYAAVGACTGPRR